MKAIIIEDKDAKALVDKLKLESLQEQRFFYGRNPDEPMTLAEVHKVFHIVVVRWLQDQGCNLL